MVSIGNTPEDVFLAYGERQKVPFCFCSPPAKTTRAMCFSPAAKTVAHSESATRLPAPVAQKRDSEPIVAPAQQVNNALLYACPVATLAAA